MGFDTIEISLVKLEWLGILLPIDSDVVAKIKQPTSFGRESTLTRTRRTTRAKGIYLNPFLSI